MVWLRMDISWSN